MRKSKKKTFQQRKTKGKSAKKKKKNTPRNQSLKIPSVIVRGRSIWGQIVQILKAGYKITVRDHRALTKRFREEKLEFFKFLRGIDEVTEKLHKEAKPKSAQ